MFLAAELLQDVVLLPGESFAGSRGLEEGEWCDSPRRTGPSTSRGNSLFWNCLALIAPKSSTIANRFQLLAQCCSSGVTAVATGIHGLCPAR